MVTYRIRPIALCQGPRDGAHFGYCADFGASNTGCYIWFLEGPGPKVLVDAGAKAVSFKGMGATETDLISVEDGLGKLGLKPHDIDIVIVTHLHCDHIELGHLYKKARFIVQKKELDYARNPHPIDAVGFIKDTFEGLNFEVIDGDREIIPGISVLLTPGHTAGGQSVEVNTTAGRAIIAGFCGVANNFTPNATSKRMGWEVTAPLIHHDVRQAYDSVLRVKQRADIIIALHDPAFINRTAIP